MGRIAYIVLKSQIRHANRWKQFDKVTTLVRVCAGNAANGLHSGGMRVAWPHAGHPHHFFLPQQPAPAFSLLLYFIPLLLQMNEISQFAQFLLAINRTHQVRTGEIGSDDQATGQSRDPLQPHAPLPPSSFITTIVAGVILAPHLTPSVMNISL